MISSIFNTCGRLYFRQESENCELFDNKRIKFNPVIDKSLENFEKTSKYRKFISQTERDLSSLCYMSNVSGEDFINQLCGYLKNSGEIHQQSKMILFVSMPEQLEEMKLGVSSIMEHGSKIEKQKTVHCISNLMSENQICLPGILNNIFDACQTIKNIKNENYSLIQEHRNKIITENLISFVRKCTKGVAYENHWVSAFRSELKDTPYTQPNNADNDIYISEPMRQEVKFLKPFVLVDLRTSVNSGMVSKNIANEISDHALSLLDNISNSGCLNDDELHRIFVFARDNEIPNIANLLLECDDDDPGKGWALKVNKDEIEKKVGMYIYKNSDCFHNEKQCADFYDGDKKISIYGMGALWWWECDGVIQDENLSFSRIKSMSYRGVLPEAFVVNNFNVLPLSDIIRSWDPGWVEINKDTGLLIKLLHNPEVIGFLLEHDEGDGLKSTSPGFQDTPLLSAIRRGDCEAIMTLLENKNMSEDILCIHSAQGLSALHTAAMNINTDVIKTILDSKHCGHRSLSDRGYLDCSILHVIAETEYASLDRVNNVLNHKCFDYSLYSAVDNANETALYKAANRGRYDMVKALLESDLCTLDFILTENAEGKNAIQIARSIGNEDIARLIELSINKFV